MFQEGLKMQKFKLSKITQFIISITGGIVSLNAFGTPISIQGVATSDNAVTVGANAYATSINGIANGYSSIATGQGFSRDDFVVKVAENKAAVDAVNGKQDELNNANNQLDATNNAIGDLTKQIDDLTKQQASIGDKLKQRDALLPTQKDAQDKVNTDTEALNNAKTALDNISASGKNLYLNFTDVLNTLNWSVLNGTDAGRNTVASELQSKIESNFTDFAGRYTEQDYRDIVDGYINRQAGYQGSYEYFREKLENSVKLYDDQTFLNDLYYNTKLNNSNYLSSDNYNLTLNGNYYFAGNSYGDISSSSIFGSAITKDNKSSSNIGLYRPQTSIGFKNEMKDYLKDNISNDEIQSILNTYTLSQLSQQKFISENKYTALNNAVTAYHIIDSDLNLSVGEKNFKDIYNNLIKSKVAVSQLQFGIRTISGENLDSWFYDKNIGILTKLRDLSVNNSNLISTEDINYFKSFYKEIQDRYNIIDWGYASSPYNLSDYKESLNKILAYNEKIDRVLNIYQSIIDEQKKDNADKNKIDVWTVELMSLKTNILDEISDATNFGMGIELSYNKEWSDYYLFYAKDEADKLISRINSELKLYNDKDELIVEATTKAKELQKAYDDAKKKLDQDQAELDKINKQIDDLALTETEKTTDDIKKAKETEKAQAEADKARLEDEIKKGTEELGKLKDVLANTSLKDLGLRSQAHGSNAFASGNDSIAIGTDTTVTSTDGIAIGRDSEVTGGQSIALGAENTVSGDKSIAIGVGHTVSGNRSTTIGDPNTITGDDVFVAGNNNSVASNNVMVMGNNITVGTGFDSAVILGVNSTVAAANPTSSIKIQGNTYNFAGTNPTSTVSVGKAGEERQITNVAAGRISETSTDAINGSQLYAVVEALNAIQTINIDDISDAIGTEINVTGGDNVQVNREGNNFTISATDTNTQSSSSVVDGKGLTVTATDNANGTKNYAFEAKIGDGLVFGDNGEIKATGTTLTAGDNITVEGDATSGYTIKATNTQSVVKAGNGVTVDVADNDIGTKDYTVSTKIGDGLTFGDNGEIKATGTIINAGDNITVTGDALNGYTISTKGGVTDEQLQDVINQINGIVDTNTQSTTSAGQGIIVTETDNANGTKNYAVSIKATDGLTFDDNGNIKVSDTLVKAGDNVQVSGNAKDGFTVSAKGTEITAGDNVNVSGDAKNGYTISVDNMRTTVTGGQGAEVASSDNADGSKNYTVNIKVGEGLTYDDKGNVVNDMKLTAGDNVQVSGDAKGGYTISATDMNTQATVSADKGITITETDNANGTKNYAVSAKLGKGLKMDENGAIAATAQPINGGAGVTITTNAQDEAVVNVAGVTTTTDDGKSYTRSDLTKSVGVKGDGKNIRTSTASNGDVQVKLADDVKVNSVTTGNVSISTKGVNAGGKKVTNVAPAEISPTSTDAVNGSQLHATNIQVHNNTQNIAKLGDRVNHLDTKVNKVNKEARAGIAGTVATASLPQVYMAGKSMVSAAAGHYKNENAVAVGYSRASDNGKLVFKLNSSANTRGDFTIGTGIGYQW